MANEWARGTVSLIPNVAPNHTITNALNAIQSMLVAGGWELASWSPGGNDRYFLRADRALQESWRYEGDGAVQHCGIHLYTNTPTDTEIRISTFLENTTATAVQVDTKDATATINRRGFITISWDVTTPNNFLIICGEDGFYIESGRDSSTNNLGHGAVLVARNVPELNATKANQLRWTTQGFVIDLSGECRFTLNRQNRFVTNDGTSRNFSCAMVVYSARGVSSVIQTPSPVNFAEFYIGNRDLMLGCNGVSTQDIRYAATFGQINSPEDGRYRINKILLLQENNGTDVANRAATSSSTSNTVAAGTGAVSFVTRDIRHDRQIARFVVVDYTLIPWTNLTEAETGLVYRVAEHNDLGRTSNIGIEWPTTVVTPSVT